MEKYEENVDSIDFSFTSQYIGTMLLRQKLIGRHKRIWILLIFKLALIGWLINVSKPGAELVACPELCATEITPANETGPLQILSFNMLHGFPDFNYLEQRVALLSDEIGRLAIDIVLLQEVPWTNEHGQIAQQLAEQNGFNYVYLRANGNRRLIGFEEGAAILSRYPLKNLSFTELKPAAGLFENRIVLHGTVETPQGNIDLFVTHLTNNKSSINAAQIASLLAFVQKEANFPAIVAGDFNAAEDSPQIMNLAKSWQDSYRIAYPNEPGKTCCVPDLTSSLAIDLQKRDDYLFLVPMAGQMIKTVDIEQLFTEPFAVANGRLWLSDHVGLLTTITIEAIP